jgi:hypothetical protein
MTAPQLVAELGLSPHDVRASKIHAEFVFTGEEVTRVKWMFLLGFYSVEPHQLRLVSRLGAWSE